MMKRLFFSLVFIAAASAAAEGRNYDFGTFSLMFNAQGAFTVAKDNTKILSALLFASAKSPIKNHSFFQSSDFTAKQAVISMSSSDDSAEFETAGSLTNKEMGVTLNFKQNLNITSDGRIHVRYDIETPPGLEFSESPRLLVTMPGSLVAGKGMEKRNGMTSQWLVFPESFDKTQGPCWGQGDVLRLATKFGPVEFVKGGAPIAFHDTRLYDKAGGIRIDLPGALKQPGAWQATGMVKLPAKASSMPKKKFAAAAYTPDFSTWDIYLPHLRRTPLSGWWRLKLLPNTKGNPVDDQGTKDGFYQEGFDCSGWDEILVPQSWTQKTFLRQGKDSSGKPVVRNSFQGVGWYQLKFTAPENPARLRSILRFEEVAWDAKVYLNGEPVTAHRNFRAMSMKPIEDAFEIDVTKLLRPGKDNTLSVRVFNSLTPGMEDWRLVSGIVGNVWLDLRPDTYCAETLITPAPGLKSFAYKCILSSANAPDWTYEVFEWNGGRTVATGKTAGTLGKDDLGRATLEGEVELPDAKPWSCESPFLYGIKFKDAKGEVAGVKRFGLRTFIAANGNFQLNGKPVFLRGLVKEFHDFCNFTDPLFLFNDDDSLRRCWKTFRDANINHVRFHTSYMPRIHYDILDELGILVCDELSYPETAIENSTRSDEIAVSRFNFACDKDGNIKPDFANYIRRRLEANYSHPCIAMFSYGNEIRDEGTFRLLANNLYDLYKKHDLQNRPITPSSGRFWKEGINFASLAKGDKLDYVDTHDYTGSINNLPISFCQQAIENFMKQARSAYKPQIPPVVNGETIYFAGAYYPEFYDAIWKSKDATEPDWDKYIWALTEVRKQYPVHYMMSYYYMRNWGTWGYKYNRDAGRGYYLERILEAHRKLWPEIDGFEALMGPIFNDRPTLPFSSFKFKPNAAYEPMKQICAPVTVILDHVSPNRYAGDKLAINATVVNNSENALPPIVLHLALLKDGTALQTTSVPIDALAIGEKKVVGSSLAVPTALDKEAITLKYSLHEGEKILCERKLELNVREKKALFSPLETRNTPMLYDGVENVFTGMGRPSTTALLDDYAVNFRPIKDFSALNPKTTLIIGANSFDRTIMDSGDAIRRYVEAGGRLLVFEQNFQGRPPFAQELEYSDAGYGQFAEILNHANPAVEGMRQEEFLCWDQQDWSIYHSFISPLSETAILTGGDCSYWGSDHFGMVVAQGRMGKGTLILCQAEVTKTYKLDSAAAALARNLILSALDERRNLEALPAFRGKPRKLPKIPESNACFIPLSKAANMGFADERPDDGKGGWTDQGAKNDLRMIPLGKSQFGTIPFLILDPSSNSGKSCVVVSATPNSKFPKASHPMELGKKLKSLSFLSSGGWLPDTGIVGKYIVKYVDGSTAEIPVECGVNIGDWWGASSRQLSNGECVWSGRNELSIVGLFAFTWTNPKPEVEIKSIVLEATHSSAVIGLVAITGERI